MPTWIWPELIRLAPDLLITQGLCEVCAVADGEIHRLAGVLRPAPAVLSLSARDLLRLRAEEAVLLGDEIDAAGAVPDLARAWAKLPRAAAALVAEGVSGRDVAAVISRAIAERDL